MKKIILLLSVMLSGCGGGSGSVPPTGERYITSNTVLTEDLSGAVLIVNQAGIVLDLAGHTVTPPDGQYAIRVTASDVTIKGGVIAGGSSSGGVMIASCLTPDLLSQFNAATLSGDAIRAQCAQRVTVSDMTFTGLGSQVYASVFTGKHKILRNRFYDSSAVSLYLDAESSDSEVVSNHFESCGRRDRGRQRECVAIDGSVRNSIHDNVFVEHGKKMAYSAWWHVGDNWPVSAVGTYRNCGEPITNWGMNFHRQQGADWNRIENNRFVGGSAGIIFAMRTPEGRNFDSTTCPLQIPDQSEYNLEGGNSFENVAVPVLDYGRFNQVHDTPAR